MEIRNISSLKILTEGGEGVIYEYGNNVIKIYKPSVNIASKRKKIKTLISKKLPSSVIGPIEEVFDGRGKFIGFLMKRIDGNDFKKLSAKKFITANNVTTKDILEMLVKIKNTLEILHKENIYIGDLNDQNILFDSQYNIYFIDCDSWTIGTEKCEVAMDSFKDPQLVLNNFNTDTDIYSFSVLAWKSLTRIHPFGGTMNPDIDMLERMKKGISVIDNPSVKIPRTIKSWRNLSPKLIDTLKSIFENKSRTLGTELEDMISNLKYCTKDGEYYYGKFQSCPLCDANAQVLTKPVSQGVVNGLKLISILSAEEISLVLTENTYIDKNNKVVDVKSGKKTDVVTGAKYYFTSSGHLILDYNDRFVVNNNGREYSFEKRYKSNIIVQGDDIYFLDKTNLTNITVYNKGNSVKTITACANRAYFDVDGDKFCVVNIYDNHIIFNCNGHNYDMKKSVSNQIVNYGIHHDTVTDSWLIVLEDQTGKFRTMVISEGKIKYDNDSIKYQCNLGNLCFSNGTIFIPIDGKIRGYAYSKDKFKDFECTVVDNDSKLIRKGNKFIIVNDDNLYQLG